MTKEKLNVIALVVFVTIAGAGHVLLGNFAAGLLAGMVAILIARCADLGQQLDRSYERCDELVEIIRKQSEILLAHNGSLTKLEQATRIIADVIARSEHPAGARTPAAH